MKMHLTRKTFLGIIVALIAINLLSLSLMWIYIAYPKKIFSYRRHAHHKTYANVIELLKEKYNLSQRDIKEVQNLKSNLDFHINESVVVASERGRDLFMHALEEGNTKHVDSLARLSGSLQEDIARHTLIHLQSLRKFCPKEKLESFDKTFGEAFYRTIISHPRKKLRRAYKKHLKD